MHNAVERTFLYVEERGRKGGSDVLIFRPIALVLLFFCVCHLCDSSWPKSLAIKSIDTLPHHNMLQILSFDESFDLTAEARHILVILNSKVLRPHPRIMSQTNTPLLPKKPHRLRMALG